jgi:hypothetical protein
MYFRTHRKGDFPAVVGDSGLKGAFGVVAELGNMIAGVEPGPDEKDSGFKVSKEESGKGGFTPNEIAGNIGGVFVGAFEKLSSGVEAGARCSRCIFFLIFCSIRLIHWLMHCAPLNFPRFPRVFPAFCPQLR